jgi:hypothetical protein
MTGPSREKYSEWVRKACRTLAAAMATQGYEAMMLPGSDRYNVSVAAPATVEQLGGAEGGRLSMFLAWVWARVRSS